MFLGISFYCVRAIKRKKRNVETRSDDGWPLEFQRAGNHVEALFTGRRCAIFVCKRRKARARANDDDEFK